MKLTQTELSFPVDDLKKRLGISENYKNFKDFRREVLERAQRHCAEHSPLSFTWIEERKGRKIIRLRFFLDKTEKFEAKWPLPLFKQANQPRSPASLTTENTSNPETFKKTTLINDQKKLLEVEHQEKNVKRQVDPDIRFSRQKLEEQYNQERKDAIDALYEEVAKRSDFAAVKEDFANQKLIRMKGLYDLYQKQGFNNAGLLVSFKNFIAEKYLKPEYHSFENWCEKFHSEPKA